MMLLRFIALAGVLIAIGIYAPMRATADVPNAAFASEVIEQKKKTETPPRPKPRPGPKDGGEDE